MELTIEQKSEALRIRMLYRQSRAAQIVGLLNFLVYAYFCGEVFGASSTAGIVAVGIAVTFLRNRLSRRFAMENPGGVAVDVEKWEGRFANWTAVMGILWGSVGALLPEDALLQQAFLSFVLAGTTAGATVAYCMSYRTIVSFLVFAIVPFGFNMLLSGAPVQLAMSLMLFLYVGLLLWMMKSLSACVTDSIRLRFEKDQALQDLETARNAFAQSTKMAALGEMAGGIAHEINNPLAVIRANAGVIRRLLRAEKEVDRDRAAEIADRIDVTVERIAKIVTGLRTFSREAGKDPVEEVPARELIEQTLVFCEARFRSRGIPLEIELPQDGLTIACRRVEVSQVLLNLLNNAFDAVKGLPQPWVRVRASIEGGEVQIAVSDAGTGVSEELREKIMQPFFTTKKVGEGTGLGLSIAHGIMEGHGGSLKLDTASKNTRFVMIFGARKARAAQEAPTASAAA